MVGAFAGIAIAEVIYRAGDAVYNLYEKYISLDAVSRAYQETVAKQKDADYIDPHSIEEAELRWKLATQSAKDYAEAAEKASHAGQPGDTVGIITEMFVGHDFAEKQTAAQTQADALAKVPVR